MENNKIDKIAKQIKSVGLEMVEMQIKQLYGMNEETGAKVQYLMQIYGQLLTTAMTLINGESNIDALVKQSQQIDEMIKNSKGKK